MLFFITIIALFQIICGFEPSCSSCKFFVPHHSKNSELGLCSIFKNLCYHKDKEILLSNYADHCRNNEQLCGKNGMLYELNTNKNKESNQLIDLRFLNDFDELNNKCCGEVNEKEELEQLEKDFFDIFQKIRKHNKARFYK